MAKKEDIRNYPIKKSNEMVQKTMFLLTAQEFDLLQYIVMQIKDEDTHFKPMSISVQDYCEIANIKSCGGNYDDVKKSIKSLRDKSIWIEGEESIELVSWIEERPIISKGSGTIIIKLSDYWEPYLLELKKKYTVTTLRETLPMKSVYGKRIYELLTSELTKKTGSVYVEYRYQELRDKLLGPKSDKYERFFDFKKKVLLPAMEDMKNYGNLDVEMRLKKMGRSYEYIKFIVSRRDFENLAVTGKNEEEYFKPLPGQVVLDLKDK